MTPDSIFIKKTDYTPEIIIDSEKKIFEISGRSLPEEVMDVYKSVLEWVDKHAGILIAENYKVTINLFYFNSPSARVIHKILKTLESNYSGQEGFSVHWHYENEEELEDAKDLVDEIKLPFTFVKTEDEG